MREFVYAVRGMTCGHCSDAVTRALQGIDGVGTVEVDVASGRVVGAGNSNGRRGR